MNYSRLLVGFCLAGIVFTALFYALQTRYSIHASLVNPFEGLKPLSQSVFSQESKEVQTIKTVDGELVRIFPDAYFEATDANREVVNGDVFLSAVLIPHEHLVPFLPDEVSLRSKIETNEDGEEIGSDSWLNSVLKLVEESKRQNTSENKDIQSSLNEAEASGTSFSFSDVRLGVAQVRVGKVLIQYPYSSVYISRNREAKRTEIYAVGAGVKLFYEGASEPFVLPPNNKVTIFDALINESTSLLFYTKLQKDFRVKPFDIILPTSAGSTIAEEVQPQKNIAEAWQEQEAWRDVMSVYALRAYSTLVPSSAQSVLAPTLEVIQKWQERLAFGWSKEKEDMTYFNNTLKPLVQFIKAVDTGIGKKDRKKLDDVYKNINSGQWGDLMAENQELREKWYPFEKSYQAMVRNVSENDKYFIFYDFWNDTSRIDNLRQVKILFLDSQLLYNLGQKIPSKNFLVRLQNSFQSFSLPKKEREQLTSMRRLLVNMIRNTSFFQSYELFDLYRHIATREVALNDPGSEFGNEIRLEIARESLHFLNEFVDEQTNFDASNILLELYKGMKVEDIKATLNRDIFSPEETEMITFISMLGTSRITREEIDRIKENIEREKEFERLTQQLPGEPVDGIEQPTETGYISDQKELEAFFEELDINTLKVRATVNEKEKTIRFTNAYYEGHNITGVFNIARQTFTSVSTDILEREDLRRKRFDTILKEIDAYKQAKERETIDNNNNNPGNTNMIPQNDKVSLRWREHVIKVLNSYGIQAILPSVEVLNQERTMFRISDAGIKDFGPRFTFEYDLDNERISKVVFGSGLAAVRLPQTFNISSARANIPRAFEAMKDQPKGS